MHARYINRRTYAITEPSFEHYDIGNHHFPRRDKSTSIRQYHERRYIILSSQLSCGILDR